MPLLVLSEVERKRAIDTLDTGLRHMLEEALIGEDVIAIVSHLHAKTIAGFARIETDEKGFRDWCREDVGLESRGVGRGLIASLVNVWIAARQRVERETAVQAEDRAQGRKPELPRSTQLDLRRSYQSLAGELEDRQYPSQAYINSKLADLEENELVAEALDEVTSRQDELEQGGGEEYEVDFARRGAVLKRQKLVGTLPSTTEGLREKMALMRNCWGIMRMRHGGRGYLHGLQEDVWIQYVEFVLGPHVYKHEIKDDGGRVVKRLTWQQVLRFEHEARKWAFRKVNQGACTLAEGLARVSNFDTNHELMTKYVISTLATNPSSSTAPSSSGGGHEEHTFGGKGAGGGGKNRNKVKEANKQLANLKKKIEAARSELEATTARQPQGKGAKKARVGGGNNKDKPGGMLALARKHKLIKRVDGVNVCYAYSDKGTCDDGCRFDHVCAYCGGKHSLVVCTRFHRHIKDNNLQ